MKVSIIGAGGLVGSCAAFALQLGGVARQLCLIDVNQELVQGQALDLLHGGPSSADQCIFAGGYQHVEDSDVICITAGLRRKPDESRLDLINRNTELFVSILDQIAAAGTKSTAVVVVVSNPVDVLTYLATQRLKLAAGRVIGLGTLLDTARFRSLIARAIDAPPTQVSALVLGEHGDTMVPIWSSAGVAGLPLEQMPGWRPTLAAQVFDETKKAGATVIKLKGGAGFAVGVTIAQLIHAVLLDQRSVLPVSIVHHGTAYKVFDVALSLPSVVGSAGVEKIVEVPLWPKELQALRHSAHALKRTLDQMLRGRT